MNAQEDPELPFAKIPDAPETFSPGGVVSRMVDGLGFRYYWATDGLRPQDLEFRPSEEARTAEETLDHVLGLSEIILNSALHKVNQRKDRPELSFEQKRAQTLNNLQLASKIFLEADDLSTFKVVFEGKDGRQSEFPFWNQINGPIADALWHCGQIVTFRRSSGNPLNSKASMFLGQLRE